MHRVRTAGGRLKQRSMTPSPEQPVKRRSPRVGLESALSPRLPRGHRSAHLIQSPEEFNNTSRPPPRSGVQRIESLNAALIVGTLTCQDGKAEEMAVVLTAMVEAARDEPGVEIYLTRSGTIRSDSSVRRVPSSEVTGPLGSKKKSS